MTCRFQTIWPGGTDQNRQRQNKRAWQIIISIILFFYSIHVCGLCHERSASHNKNAGSLRIVLNPAKWKKFNIVQLWLGKLSSALFYSGLSISQNQPQFILRSVWFLQKQHSRSVIRWWDYHSDKNKYCRMTRRHGFWGSEEGVHLSKKT